MFDFLEESHLAGTRWTMWLFFENLQEDLKVVYTVPAVQVRQALLKWTSAIRKEVDALFSSGTLRGVAVRRRRGLSPKALSPLPRLNLFLP